MKRMILFLCGLALIVLLAGAANAAPVVFFGEDLGLGESTPLSSWPNASAAEASFLSNLTGVGTETFESYSAGTGAPLSITFPGAGTATINGDGEVASVPVGSTNGFGRYAISGTNYWESSSVFSIAFTDPIAAFGFYGVDIGDFNGQVTLTLTNGATELLNLGNSTNIAGGSVLYWGFYDLANQYSSITFGNTAAGVDVFGFDNMTIGSLEQVTPTSPVPEPATLLLLGSGMLGFAIRRKRKYFSKKG